MKQAMKKFAQKAKGAQKKIGVALAAGMTSVAAFAQTAPTTPGELAASVDFSSVGLAMLAVAGVICSLYVTWRGARFVISAVRGA